MSRLIHTQRSVHVVKRWSAAIGDYPAALAWSPDGRRLAAASISGPLCVYDRDSGAVGASMPGHAFGSTSLAWHPSGDLLASGGQDGSIRLWPLNHAIPPTVWTAGSDWVARVIWTPDGTNLIWAAGKTVMRVAYPAGTPLDAPCRFPATVADVAWSPDHTGLAATAHGGIWLWTPGRFDRHRLLAWKGASHLMRWSPDGRFIATADQDATVHFWFSDSGVDLRMTGFPRKICAFAWDARSRYLATASAEILPVWDCSGPTGPEGRPPIMLEGPHARVTGLDYQHQGVWLAAGYENGHVLIWEPGASLDPLLQTPTVQSGAVVQLAWSPDDRYLAAGTSRGEISVFETKRNTP